MNKSYNTAQNVFELKDFRGIYIDIYGDRNIKH